MFDKAAQAISQAIEEMRAKIHEMLGQLAQLEAARRVLVGAARGGAPAKKKGKSAAPQQTMRSKRKLSPAARQALSARMKAKWAALRAQKAA